MHRLVAAGEMEVLAAGVAVGTLGDADQRDARDAEAVQHLARDAELPAAAVDQHQVGPRREFVARRVGLPGVRLGIRFELGQLRLG